MVVPGTLKKVLWIDFDRAQTHSKSLTPHQQRWFDHELVLIDCFARALVGDVNLH